ncbi:hypothetical protein [Nocardia asiatica]
MKRHGEIRVRAFLRRRVGGLDPANTVEILLIEVVDQACDDLALFAQALHRLGQTRDAFLRVRKIGALECFARGIVSPAVAFPLDRGLQLVQYALSIRTDVLEFRNQCPKPFLIDPQRLRHTRLLTPACGEFSLVRRLLPGGQRVRRPAV